MYFLLIFSVATLILAMPRTLDKLRWLGLLSVALIALAGILAMIAAGLNPTKGRTISATVPTTFYQAFLAITNPVCRRFVLPSCHSEIFRFSPMPV
jgi:hypothetical protein